MKIAYLAYWDVSREDGVLKKIAGQIRAWQSLGAEVRLFAVGPAREIWAGIEDLEVDATFSPRTLTNLVRTGGVVRRVLRWRPDVVYHRFHLYYPGLVRLMRRTPTCVELVSNDLSQQQLTQPWHENVYHRLTRPLALKRAAGFVGISREILSGAPDNGRPRTVIGDGVDLAGFPELPAPVNERPKIALVSGNVNRPWVGFDKFLWLARRFGDWEFHVIGVTRDELGPGVPGNVRAHGFLGKREYEPLLAGCDAAVGSLALHRIALDECSPLKLREYLAYGLPAIIGYRDTDFPEPAPFLLELPNTEDNVVEEAARIEEFVGRWRGRRVSRHEIRHLDSRTKEAERLGFIARLHSGQDPTPEIEHRTSNIQHRTSNIEHEASNIEHGTRNTEHRTRNAT